MEEMQSVLDTIRSIVIQGGYEAQYDDAGLVSIRDPESGICVRAVLEDDVLYFTVPCFTLPEQQVNASLMRRMLSSDNGISTSSFQLYPGKSGTTVVTLNNFCKLQKLGDDDTDDILACLGFLLADSLQARHLFGEQLAPHQADR